MGRERETRQKDKRAGGGKREKLGDTVNRISRKGKISSFTLSTMTKFLNKHRCKIKVYILQTVSQRQERVGLERDRQRAWG